MFGSRFDQIIDLSHEKVVLVDRIDWRILSECFGAAYMNGPGHPPLSTRLMTGLHFLKHADDLSDEELCARLVENPYYHFAARNSFARICRLTALP